MQGQLGDCYIMSSLSTVAEKSSIPKGNMLTQYKNTAGIYAVTMYIRGKPWVISVDEKLLFTSSNNLLFAKEDSTGSNVWSAIYEKAWAKVRGSYDSTDSGFV